MIVLAYPVTTARLTKFEKDELLSQYMEQFSLIKFDGGVENGFHTLRFEGISEPAEDLFMIDPEKRAAELQEVAGFPVQFYQQEKKDG